MLNIINKNQEIKEEFFYLERKALRFYKRKKYKQSFEYYKKVLKASNEFKNNSNESHFKWYDEILSNCLKKYSDNYDEFFKCIYSMNIENYDAWFDKAKLYGNNNKRNEAIIYCYKLLKIRPDDLDLLEFTGHNLCFSHRYDESLKIYDIALSIDKNNKDLIQDKWYVYYTSDRIYDALEFCKNLENTDDITSTDYQALGFRFEEKEEYETALWCYKKGFEIEETDHKEFDTDSVDAIKRMLLKLSIDDYSYINEFYLEWISKIEHKFETTNCSKCGGKLTPIIYGLVVGDEVFEEQEKGNIIVGGCSVDESSPTHYCKKCDEEFNFRFNGLKIDYPFYTRQNHYVIKIIGKLSYYINDSQDEKGIKIEKLKNKMRNYGLDDLEFDALINKLIDIGYLNKSNECNISLCEDNYYSLL